MAVIGPYKGYTGVLEVDVDDGVLHGTVSGIRDVIHFEGTTVAEVKASFRQLIDAYLAMCEEEGMAPDKPYSGKLLVRMTPDMHRDLARKADSAARSMNELVNDALRAYLHGK